MLLYFCRPDSPSSKCIIGPQNDEVFQHGEAVADKIDFAALHLMPCNWYFRHWDPQKVG